MPPEIRQLIRDMSITNPLWGAPRIISKTMRRQVLPSEKILRALNLRVVSGKTPPTLCLRSAS
jgi:hypothetical protein